MRKFIGGAVAVGNIGRRRAAPHPPAGTFSPYSDGEKGAAARLALTTLMIGESDDEGVFLPVPIRGEMSGRTMRGGGDL
ncbi:MAG: hypothetical protein EOQ39_30450 [Mesorhizobium sp.]|nr:MAG: hypothetical protein EOQ37_34785 [Mesorhizobium sp.]RWB10802.1 MAG: hypothetical protein EOQ39_30450 [Mesorhizobium sp.]RWO71714.1 MAG: hypothetical protein EOS17_09895 [Mesorhizobium sp.]